MNQKLKQSLISIGILICLVIAIKKIYHHLTVPHVTYPNFGIDIPLGYKTIGIDVSHHQGTINWELLSKMRDSSTADSGKVKKIEFAFIKATQGNHFTDKQFNRNWSEAKEYGITRGAYLYFEPDVNGVAQARLFRRKVDLSRGDLPPVVDVEEINAVDPVIFRKNVSDCLNELQGIYKVKPIIYSGANFYNTHLNGYFDDYPFWVAHYKSTGSPKVEREWSFWQHSDKGRVDGIEGEQVDFNVLNSNILTASDLSIY